MRTNLKRKIFLITSLILSASLIACSGGGGSSDSGGSTDTSNIFGSNGQSASTGVRVLNGAIDAAPIDLYSSEKSAVLETARFGLAYPFKGLSTNPQIVSITRTQSPGNNLFSKNITLNNNERSTILLYGSNRRFGLNTTYLADSRPVLDATSAAIRIIHSAIGASQLNLVIPSKNLTASFGNASEYAVVPAGVLGATVTRTADGQVIHSASHQLDAGKSYSLFATGEVGYFTSTKFLED
jgi:hypothetical protein